MFLYKYPICLVFEAFLLLKKLFILSKRPTKIERDRKKLKSPTTSPVRPFPPTVGYSSSFLLFLSDVADLHVDEALRNGPNQILLFYIIKGNDSPDLSEKVVNVQRPIFSTVFVVG